MAAWAEDGAIRVTMPANGNGSRYRGGLARWTWGGRPGAAEGGATRETVWGGRAGFVETSRRA